MAQPDWNALDREEEQAAAKGLFWARLRLRWEMFWEPGASKEALKGASRALGSGEGPDSADPASALLAKTKARASAVEKDIKQN